MVWHNPQLTPEFKQWFMGEIEALCKYKDKANFAIHHGKLDCELEILVHDDDKEIVRAAIPEFINKVKEKIGVFSPVIYMYGEADPEMEAYKNDPYYCG